jgi:hypothetical protein
LLDIENVEVAYECDIGVVLVLLEKGSNRKLDVSESMVSLPRFKAANR